MMTCWVIGLRLICACLRMLRSVRGCKVWYLVATSGSSQDREQDKPGDDDEECGGDSQCQDLIRLPTPHALRHTAQTPTSNWTEALSPPVHVTLP